MRSLDIWSFVNARAALSNYTYTVSDKHDGQALRSTFKGNLCPVALLHAGSFMQLVYGAGKLFFVCNGRAQVYWLVDVHPSSQPRTQRCWQKGLSVRMTHPTGNIVPLIVETMVSAGTALLHRVAKEALKLTSCISCKRYVRTYYALGFIPTVDSTRNTYYICLTDTLRWLSCWWSWCGIKRINHHAMRPLE